MPTRLVEVFVVVTACLALSCGGTAGSTTSGVAQTTVEMMADFTAAASQMTPPSPLVRKSAAGESAASFRSSPVLTALKLSSCPTPAPTDDHPELEAGLDCDQDGGVVSYLTPSVFRIAVKRLALMKSDSTEVEFIADSGTLANAQVLDLTSLLSLPPQALSLGTYQYAEFQIYYVEMQFLINAGDESTRIRIYLSDDDFPSEGNLGHHQGDITFINPDTGAELGFVKPGEIWTTSNLSPTRTFQSSEDPETGHLRGAFGNTDLWNSEAFRQGTDRDLFIYRMALGVTLPVEIDATVTVAFPVRDSWFWEDFDGDGKFGPCIGSPGHMDACMDNAAWAPILNPPELAQ